MFHLTSFPETFGAKFFQVNDTSECESFIYHWVVVHQANGADCVAKQVHPNGFKKQRNTDKTFKSADINENNSYKAAKWRN